MHGQVTASTLIRVGFDRIDPDLCHGAPNRSATEIGVVFLEADAEINCILHIHPSGLTSQGILRPMTSAEGRYRSCWTSKKAAGG